MGPPGQAGFQGGPGLQGNMGPRGMALQGKLVSKFLIFLWPEVEFLKLLVTHINFFLKLTCFLFKPIYIKGPTGARGEKGDPGRPGGRVC